MAIIVPNIRHRQFVCKTKYTSKFKNLNFEGNIGIVSESR